MRRLIAALLLAAPIGCAGMSGPRGKELKDVSFAPPRTESEAETRLHFLEQRLDAGRKHAQIWFWSWLAINGGGAVSSAVSAADEDENHERVHDIVEASKATVGVIDLLVRPIPGRHGADPVRDAAARGASTTEQVAEGERLLIETARRANHRWDWRYHAGNVLFNAVGGGVLLAVGAPGLAAQSFGQGVLGGELQLWSEPWRAPGDLADYQRLVATGLPPEPKTSWRLAPIENGLALQVQY